MHIYVHSIQKCVDRCTFVRKLAMSRTGRELAVMLDEGTGTPIWTLLHCHQYCHGNLCDGDLMLIYNVFMLGEGAGMAIYILHCDDCDGSDDIHES